MMKRRHVLLLGGLAWAPLAQAALRFPHDFGAHPESALEWWYLTGILFDEQKLPRFGYQLTFFRLRGPADVAHPSRFAARQLLLAHVALSDLKAGTLRHDQRLARAGFGLAEAAEGDSDMRIRDWSLRRDPRGYDARFDASTFALQLRLQTTQPVLLQGQSGLSRKGPAPDQFSHYYSQVQLQTTARLRVDGRDLSLQGRSWLDHEWSDSLLGHPGTDQAVGWDWLGINLDDGGALTAFRLRRADGSLLWSGGSWRKPDGSTQDFKPEQLVMRPLRRWHSALSNADYPVDWELDTPLGTVRLQALIDAQEIDARLSTGMRYWEGAAKLSTPDGRRLGLGYLELTGYAGRMALG